MMKGLASGRLDDIDPIINVFSSYQMLAVRGDADWKTAQDFIKAVRQSPGKYSLGHTGNGTASHLNMAQLVQAAKLNVLEVPYKGWRKAAWRCWGGHVDAIVINAGEGRALVDEGPPAHPGRVPGPACLYHPTCPPSRRSATTWAWA